LYKRCIIGEIKERVLVKMLALLILEISDGTVVTTLPVLDQRI
jgi:hypothetical protein